MKSNQILKENQKEISSPLSFLKVGLTEIIHDFNWEEDEEIAKSKLNPIPNFVYIMSSIPSSLKDFVLFSDRENSFESLVANFSLETILSKAELVIQEHLLESLLKHYTQKKIVVSWIDYQLTQPLPIIKSIKVFHFFFFFFSSKKKKKKNYIFKASRKF